MIVLEVLYDTSDPSEEFASARIRNTSKKAIRVAQSTLAIYMQREKPAGEAFEQLTSTSCADGHVGGRGEFFTDSHGNLIQVPQPTREPSVNTAAPAPNEIVVNAGQTIKLAGAFLTTPMCNRFIPKKHAKIYATITWSWLGEQAAHLSSSPVKDILW